MCWKVRTCWLTLQVVLLVLIESAWLPATAIAERSIHTTDTDTDTLDSVNHFRKTKAGITVSALIVILLPLLLYFGFKWGYRKCKLRHVRVQYPFHVQLIEKLGLPVDSYSPTDVPRISPARFDFQELQVQGSAEAAYAESFTADIFKRFLNDILSQFQIQAADGEFEALDSVVGSSRMTKKTRGALSGTFAKVLIHRPEWDTVAKRNPKYWVFGRYLPKELMEDDDFKENVVDDWDRLLQREYPRIAHRMRRGPL